MDDTASRSRRPAGQSVEQHDLVEAFGKPGCALCRLAAVAVERYLDEWTSELFTDSGNRQTLVQAGGFCSLHTWAIAEQHAAFELAVAYHDILAAHLRDDTREQVPSRQAQSRENPVEQDADDPGGWWNRLLGRAAPQGPQNTDVLEATAAARWKTCPACQVRAEREARALATFARYTGEPTFRQAFAASDGLCLQHFAAARRTCTATNSEDTIDWMDETERACLGRAVAELVELIRKHDYRFRDEPQGEEMLSWLLAAELVASRKGLW